MGKRHCWPVALLGILWLTNSAASAEPPGKGMEDSRQGVTHDSNAPGTGRTDDATRIVNTLSAGMEKRQSQYVGLKFEYSAVLNGVEGREVYKLLRSNDPRSIAPWRYWERRVRAKDGAWVVDRILAVEGKKELYFRRTEMKQGRGWHKGLIRPEEDPNETQENVLEGLLFQDHNQIPKFIVQDPRVSKQMDARLPYKVTDKRDPDGRTVYTLSRETAGIVRNEVHISGAPEFMMLRSDNWGVPYPGKPGDKMSRVELLEILKVGKYQEVYYPARLSFQRWPAGSLSGLGFEMEVTSVEPLAEEARKNWFPAWPPSTAVSDMINGGVFTTPREVQK